MIIIGIDPHKSTHTATALEPATNTDLGSLRIEATLAEYTRLLTWSKTWSQRTWAIENAEGLGHHLAQWLLAAGESVLDIPTTATARVRQLSKGSRRKNDRIDAAAAASVAAMQGDARPVQPESTTDMLALLDERRNNLTAARTRIAKTGATRARCRNIRATDDPRRGPPSWCVRRIYRHDHPCASAASSSRSTVACRIQLEVAYFRGRTL